MTIKGRTTQKWGRDKSARWDSNPDNGFRTRSYPHVDARAPAEPVIPKTETATLPGRTGRAERRMVIDRYANDISITTIGWYPTSVHLNERQIAFLRDTLNKWFPPE